MMRNIYVNLFSKKISQKVLCFSVDDFGLVRCRSRESLLSLRNQGYDLTNRYDSLDCLENTSDMRNLEKLLSSFRDSNGEPAKFSLFYNMQNPDFLESLKLNQLILKDLRSTFDEYERSNPLKYEGVWEATIKGIDSGVFCPEYHGRTHFDIAAVDGLLIARNKEIQDYFRERSFLRGRLEVNGKKITNGLHNNSSINQKSFMDGLSDFNKIFGYPAKNFNSSGSILPEDFIDFASKSGISAIDFPLSKNPIKALVNRSGTRINKSCIRLVRNCVFEPSFMNGVNWVDKTFSQIEWAFSLEKPAIVSSHRVNFVSGIDSENASIGHELLFNLLRKVVKSHPDVRFAFTRDLINEYLNEAR